MEEQTALPQSRPRRRRKTPMQIFKEAYLPYLILLVATIFIIVLILGSISQANAATCQAVPALIDCIREV